MMDGRVDGIWAGSRNLWRRIGVRKLGGVYQTSIEQAWLYGFRSMGLGGAIEGL